MPIPFTKDDVVTAYKNLKEKGVKPISGTFVGIDHGAVCSLCAMSAVIVDRGIVDLKSILDLNIAYNEVLGMTEVEMWSFVEGFDRGDVQTVSAERHRTLSPASFKLGVECREAVFDNGNV